MAKSALETVIDSLTNERLDKIVIQNKDYISLANEIRKVSDTIKNDLTKEQYRRLTNYTDLIFAANTLYVELAYKQALADVLSAITELASMQSISE